jgi:hypothetical protein
MNKTKSYFAIISLIISFAVSPLSTFANTDEKPKESPQKRENAETTLNYDDTKKLFENNENKSSKTAQPLEKPVPTTNTFTNSYFYWDAINSTTTIMAIGSKNPLSALFLSSIGYRYQENHHGFEISAGIPRVTFNYLYFQDKKLETFYYGLGAGICYVPGIFGTSYYDYVLPYPKVFLGYQWKKDGKTSSYVQLDILTMPTISYGICF